VERRQPNGPLGAYGFEIEGLREPELHLAPVEPSSPVLRIVHEPRGPTGPGRIEPAGTVRVEPETAELWMADGDRIVLDRDTLTARFVTRARFDDEVIVHPYLGLPASIASHWLGRQALHGGAFRLGGAAWALVGDREAGKSSILAWVLRRGHEAVSDDILILDGRDLFAGPRSIDLRQAPAERLGGEHLGVVGSRDRWRLQPGTVPPRTPLAGVVHLEWSDDVSVDPIPSAERLTALVQHCVLRPRHQESLAYLDIASLDAWRFARPRALEGLDDANSQLLAALDRSTAG